jgi:hypothetical protein
MYSWLYQLSDNTFTAFVYITICTPNSIKYLTIHVLHVYTLTTCTPGCIIYLTIHILRLYTSATYTPSSISYLTIHVQHLYTSATCIHLAASVIWQYMYCICRHYQPVHLAVSDDWSRPSDSLKVIFLYVPHSPWDKTQSQTRPTVNLNKTSFKTGQQKSNPFKTHF